MGTISPGRPEGSERVTQRREERQFKVGYRTSFQYGQLVPEFAADLLSHQGELPPVGNEAETFIHQVPSPSD